MDGHESAPAGPGTPRRPRPELFGDWLAASDGAAHYDLGGAFLCGSPAEPTGRPVWRKDGAGTPRVAVPYCERCLRLNTHRWAKGGAA